MSIMGSYFQPQIECEEIFCVDAVSVMEGVFCSQFRELGKLGHMKILGFFFLNKEDLKGLCKKPKRRKYFSLASYLETLYSRM